MVSGMDMTQSRIVKAVKGGIVHLADTAYHRLRAPTKRFSTVFSHVLMGNDNISLSEIHILSCQQFSNGSVIVPNIRSRGYRQSS